MGGEGPRTPALMLPVAVATAVGALLVLRCRADPVTTGRTDDVSSSSSSSSSRTKTRSLLWYLGDYTADYVAEN